MKWLMLVTVAIAMLLAACGGGSDNKDSDKTTGGSSSGVPLSVTPDPGVSSNTGGSPNSGSCDVKISGDQSLDFKGLGGPSAAGSDYWFLTDSELSGATKPTFFILILNCVSGQGASKNSLSFLPAMGTTYTDLPFKPGVYNIPAGGVLGADGKPGDIAVLLALGKTTFAVSGAGKLTITRFDKTGIAGTFQFKAQETATATPRNISVEGAFDFRCSGGPNCTK